MTEKIHPTVEAADQWQELLRPHGGQVFPVVPENLNQELIREVLKIFFFFLSFTKNLI